MIVNLESFANAVGISIVPPDPPAPPPVPGAVVVVTPPVQSPLEVNMSAPVSFLTAVNAMPLGLLSQELSPLGAAVLLTLNLN